MHLHPSIATSTSAGTTGHGRGGRDCSHTALPHEQPRSHSYGFKPPCGPLKFWLSSAYALVCLSLFKYECFHTFFSNRIGCTAPLAGCLLPACTSAQIKNRSWPIGWWYYLLSLGETAGKGKGVKPEMSYWDCCFWKLWGKSAPGVGKCHIVPTEMKKKQTCEVIVSGISDCH